MWQIQKVADEGTAEPFMARLMLGALELRDLLIDHLAQGDEDRERRRRHFDDRYTPVMDALGSARTHDKAIRQLLAGHSAKIVDGSIVSRQRNAVQISESINAGLQGQLASFLSSSVRAAKLLQALLSYVDVEIGILFQRESRFLAGVEQLRRAGETAFADYLAATRQGWSEVLIERRHALEHKGWRLPDVRYVEQADGSLSMIEPEVNGQPVSQFASRMLDRLLGFVEDTLAFAVQRGLAGSADLIDTPKAERDPGNVKRFRLGLPALQPNERFWQLRYTGLGLMDS